MMVDKMFTSVYMCACFDVIKKMQVFTMLHV
jgi:hypothetical protein